MVRTTLGLLGVVAGVMLLTLLTPNKASAQSIANQVTCVTTGPNSPQNCLDANGFKQSIAVTCGSFPSLGQALAQITDRNGPNRIAITGACTNVSATIVGHNRLTLEGAVTIRSLQIVNSTNITLKSLTVNAATTGPALTLNSSEVALDGATIQGGCCDVGGANLLGNSVLSGSTNGLLSTITGNFGSGVEVGAGSILNALNMTISNNSRQGIFAHNGGTVNLISRSRVFPGPFVNTPLDISGNAQEGIEFEAGILSATAEGGGPIHIHDNGKTGLDMGGGVADLEGNLLFENNGPGDFGDAEAGVAAGTLVFGQGAVINGPIVAFHSTLLLGSGGSMTHTGGVQLLQGSLGAVAEGSTVNGMECDGTSWVTQSFGAGTITNSTCPLEGPTGANNVSGIQSITAGSGILSTGGQTPTLSLDTNATDARYLQLSGGQLSGALTAPSFAGNGGALTNLDPTKISAGTAGISVTGNAATATDATKLGGVLSANYARTDVGNAFAGNQTVTGNLSAAAFSGNGSALTNLNPASLSPGTAGINISGNANTATNASNATALGGVLAANYARRDVSNAFTGNQSVTGNISATGSLAVGGGTAITQHLSATFGLQVPSMKPSQCFYYYPLSLPGAVAGGNDTIAVGVPYAFLSAGGFLMVNAWEYTANNILIRVCNVNPNGPATSAFTDTVRVDLWKH